MNTNPSNYLATADVWTVLDLIAMEFKSDPTSVQCFDLRLVKRAIELQRTGRPDYVMTLTASQLMALRSVLIDYITRPDHTEVFIDIVRGVETPVEELLLKVTPAPGGSQ